MKKIHLNTPHISGHPHSRLQTWHACKINHFEKGQLQTHQCMKLTHLDLIQLARNSAKYIFLKYEFLKKFAFEIKRSLESGFFVSLVYGDMELEIVIASNFSQNFRDKHVISQLFCFEFVKYLRWMIEAKPSK